MQVTSFSSVVEAVDQLPLDEQEVLLDILRKRIIASRRAELAKEIQIARKEFQNGDYQLATPSEITKEILS